MAQDNGATEIPGTTYDSRVVFLGSPIRHWWTKTPDGKTLHETPQFEEYARFREELRTVLSEHFLVYSPHLSLKGPWNETVGNLINNTALIHSDVFVRIAVPNAEAKGTDREEAIARAAGLPVFKIDYQLASRWSIHWRHLIDAIRRSS